MATKKQEPVLAYQNQQFLESDAGRQMRILSEFRAPGEVLDQANVQNTIVMFGSARTLGPRDVKKQLKAAKKLPEGAERENRIKGAVFLKRIFDTNCMRTLSMSAGRSFPFNIAEGFVELGNGHVLRGIKAMKKSYKIKEKGAKTK